MTSSRWLQRAIVLPGFMKAGSTSLHTWIGGCLPGLGRPKEPETLLRPGGHVLVSELVAARPDWDGVYLDSSVTYLDPSNAERAANEIHRLDSSARIVIAYRDPLSRAISHLRHDARQGERQVPDAAAAADLIRQGSEYVNRSRVADAIAPFLDRFEHTSILIVASERGDQEKAAALNSFLDIDIPASALVSRYRTDQMGSYTRGLKAIKDRGWLPALERVTPQGLRPVAARVFLRPPPSPIERSEVDALLDPGVRELLDEQRRQFESSTHDCIRA